MSDYKDTLFMGKTDFEMRGNLGKKEPLIQEKWFSEKLYDKVMEKNQDLPLYTLHDGPPYANGDIHLGHALNKILKDIVVRYKNMNGFKATFIPGWDTHGLPIETALQKQGVNRKEKTSLEFRQLCGDYALGQIQRQIVGFKRIGVIADYDNPYITLQKEFEKDQILVFSKMVEKGLIYKGLKPVYWSPSSESALAEAEIEYHDKEDLSIYLKFPIIGNDELKEASFVVWTTTPWTLPANLAVCAGPEITYVLVNTSKGKLIFAKDLQEKLTSLLALENVEVIKEYLGKDLEKTNYQHPLFDKTGFCVLGEHVTTTDGSGLVHTAPGHGEDDFNVGKEYGLEVLCPVDNRGIMTSEAHKYEGMYYEKASLQIIEDLTESNLLLKLLPIMHSYPHDWRTKKPIIFRATPQWFASIDPIKEDLLKAIDDVNWLPKWGNVRMSNMIKDRHDWCISRQRVWGVPIPVFYAENGDAILTTKTLNHVADLFGEYGSNVWYEREAKDLLPSGFTHEGSPNGIFYKETDIMDVWFDSGTSHQLLNRQNLNYPADLYLEGSDQYRGWFNSSLITGVSITGKSPYKAVLSHGFTLDGKGRKMSKSLGNTVDPIKTSNEFGADILRLWVSSIEYRSDMPISKELLTQVSETYRKIRNTMKFLFANTADFDSKNALPYEKLENVDKYMYIKLQEFISEVKENYDNFNFGEIYRLVNTYLTNTLSSFYLDFTKDILYIEHPTTNTRLSVQTVFNEILVNLIKLLSPIIPHTMSEAYNFIDDTKDVYLTNMPKVNLVKDEHLVNNFDEFLKLRIQINKALEESRAAKVIGKSFNAHVILSLTKNQIKLFDDLKANIAQLLIVSQVTINEANEFNVVVEAASGNTCERCWQVVKEDLNEGLCGRCLDVVSKLKI